MVVQPGCEASQNALKLVAAVSAVDVSFAAPNSGQPSVIEAAGITVNGLNPVARCLVESASADVSAKLLGSTPEEQAMVSNLSSPLPKYPSACPFLDAGNICCRCTWVQCCPYH